MGELDRARDYKEYRQKKNTTLGALSHILGFITNFIAPLIIFLLANNDFHTKENSKEALNFQITILITSIAAGILSAVFIGQLLYPLIFLFNLIFSIIGTLEAYKGVKYKYPYTLRLIK